MGLVEEIQDTVTREVEARMAEIRAGFSGWIDPEDFSRSTLTVPQAARLLNWDARTLKAYVAHGMIPLHPDSTKAKPLLSASEVLRLPGRKLKHTRLN